jgi:hypothetical protein
MVQCLDIPAHNAMTKLVKEGAGKVTTALSQRDARHCPCASGTSSRSRGPASVHGSATRDGRATYVCGHVACAVLPISLQVPHGQLHMPADLAATVCVAVCCVVMCSCCDWRHLLGSYCCCCWCCWRQAGAPGQSCIIQPTAVRHALLCKDGTLRQVRTYVQQGPRGVGGCFDRELLLRSCY